MTGKDVATVDGPGTDVTQEQLREALPMTVDSPTDAMLRVAIDSGNMDIVERLVALREREVDRAANMALTVAVVDLQNRLPSIHKSQTAKITKRDGGTYQYPYASLDDIGKAIRPHLKELGLSYAWDVADLTDGIMFVTCIVTHIDGAEKRATFPCPVANNAAMSDAQKYGGALTSAKRQSLTSVLGLTMADEDDDAPQQREATVISAEQVKTIEALIENTKTDRARFLKHVKVSEFAHLPASRFTDLVDLINANYRASQAATEPAEPKVDL